jgi:hypothetical protein
MVATISLLSGSLLGASWNQRQRRTLTVSICLHHLISWLSFSLWYGLCTSLPLVACLGSVSSFFLLVLSLALPLPSQHITCCDCNCFRGCLCLLVQLIVGAVPVEMIWEERTRGTANGRHTEMAEVRSWVRAWAVLADLSATTAHGRLASAPPLEPALCRRMWLTCKNRTTIRKSFDLQDDS